MTSDELLQSSLIDNYLDPIFIKKWIDYFQEIGIHAKESLAILPPYHVIEVQVLCNYESFKSYIPHHPLKGCLKIYALYQNGQFNLHRSYGEPDLIFKNWYEEFEKSSPQKWIELHIHVTKLFKKYQRF